MATKRSCCIRFSCFSSSSSSDEKGQDHPTPATVRSSPSAIDNTIETLQGAPKRTEAPIPGSSNVVTPMKYEIEHVDVNLNVSGTHQGDKAPLIESLNILRKSEDEDVNGNLNVSGRTQCNEASSSGSSNVPDISNREDVDANPNVLGAPRCDEAPSSSSSSGATKPDVINTILHKDIAQVKGKFVDVNLDDLMEHISELLKLREEEMLLDKKASNPSNFPWPDVPGFKKLNAIVSWGTDLKNLKELLSSGVEFASKFRGSTSGKPEWSPRTTLRRKRFPQEESRHNHPPPRVLSTNTNTAFSRKLTDVRAPAVWRAKLVGLALGAQIAAKPRGR